MVNYSMTFLRIQRHFRFASTTAIAAMVHDLFHFAPTFQHILRFRHSR